ncbi:MAG: hypothetical protein RR135_00305 [Oscillospiraceae bacterium]
MSACYCCGNNSTPAPENNTNGCYHCCCHRCPSSEPSTPTTPSCNCGCCGCGCNQNTNPCASCAGSAATGTSSHWICCCK